MRNSSVQLCLFVASVLVYWNALSADFAFDDAFAILGNKDVTDDSQTIWSILKHDFWGQDIRSQQSHKSYRPITVIAFRWVWKCWRMAAPTTDAVKPDGGNLNPDALDRRGLDPFPFHLANVVLHGLVSVLVFRLSLKLSGLREAHSRCFTERDATYPASHQNETSDAATTLKSGRESQLRHRSGAKVEKQIEGSAKPKQDAATKGSPRHNKTASQGSLVQEAALSAIMFSLHPVHTEAIANDSAQAVTGLVGLAEILCAIFGLTGLLFYIRAAENRGGSGHFRFLFLAVMCSMLAALSKEIGITVVGSMALLDVVYLSFNRSGGGVKKPGFTRNRIGMIFRVILLGSTGVAYVMLRSWVSGGHQIVNIYRKVENPIPFAESMLVRVLTTLHVHARYAWLLIYPMHLSADWSYACIPYVETVGDFRNLLTAGLYAVLLYVVLAAKPWKIVWEFLTKLSPDPSLAGARWRFLVMIGLMVGPFFPASNVLFYVGTVIGERLLYFPSIGFCMLAAQAFMHKSDGQSSGGRNLDPARRVTKYLSVIGIASLLAFYSWRTIERNRDWKDEEALFLAAQKVCSNSAKVRLNSGIVERRHGNWEAALDHFNTAMEIEPSYCDPIYWIGSTLVNAKKIDKAIPELKKALPCVHVARHALEALNKVYVALTEAQPDNPMAALGWGEVLLDPTVNRTGDACVALEQASILAAFNFRSRQVVNAATQHCIQALQQHIADLGKKKSSPMLRLVQDNDLLSSGIDPRKLLKCVKGRRKVAFAVAEHGHQSEAAKRSVYKYIKEMANACRGSEMGTNVHQLLIVRFQNADSEDPWLQLEWGKVVIQSGQPATGKKHLEVAGMMFSSYLSTFLARQQNPTEETQQSPQRPLPMSMQFEGPITPREALEAGVESLEVLVDLEDAGGDGRKGGTAEVCYYLSHVCDIRMKGTLILNQKDKRWMDRCLEGLRDRPRCSSELSQTIKILKSRFPE
ncbi:hypothetical protein BSKO_04985 [Bryopsis sp. KO-2023]|nr:hypothetical protein BSKO_04985 [Bryopsis sp. KO-2023]